MEPHHPWRHHANPNQTPYPQLQPNPPVMRDVCRSNSPPPVKSPKLTQWAGVGSDDTEDRGSKRLRYENLLGILGKLDAQGLSDAGFTGGVLADDEDRRPANGVVRGGESEVGVDSCGGEAGQAGVVGIEPCGIAGLCILV